MRTACALWRARLLFCFFDGVSGGQGGGLEVVQQGFGDPPRNIGKPGLYGRTINPARRHPPANPGGRALNRVPDLGAFSRARRMFETGAAAAVDDDATAAGAVQLLTAGTMVGAYAVLAGSKEPLGKAP